MGVPTVVVYVDGSPGVVVYVVGTAGVVVYVAGTAGVVVVGPRTNAQGALATRGEAAKAALAPRAMGSIEIPSSKTAAIAIRFIFFSIT
jgi:hypothetical protein